MQNELTESQINFYQENGFLVIENFSGRCGIGRMATLHR